jgi:YgiT-type zinc finger domain-containing protein
MIGELAKNSECPVCGGRLKQGLATAPFFLTNAVVLVKGVPSEICASCHEPYTTGKVTDRILKLLRPCAPSPQRS